MIKLYSRNSQSPKNRIRVSERPKRVNTEITETEISVWFTEPKPIIPNRISQYIRFSVRSSTGFEHDEKEKLCKIQ